MNRRFNQLYCLTGTLQEQMEIEKIQIENNKKKSASQQTNYLKKKNNPPIIMEKSQDKLSDNDQYGIDFNGDE